VSGYEVSVVRVTKVLLKIIGPEFRNFNLTDISRKIRPKNMS